MLRVDVLSTMRELACLEPEWATLWLSSATSVFQSPYWLIPWWSTFHDGRELFAVTVRRDSNLVALLPLYRQPRGNFHDLVFVGTGNSDHLDIIASTADDEAVRAALSVLTEMCSHWDTLDLHEVPEGSLLLTAGAGIGFAPEIAIQSHCPVVPFPITEDAAVGSARLRQALAYATRRIADVGTLRRVDASAGNCREFFGELVRLHSTRWQSRGEPGVLCDEQTLTFHQRAIVPLCEANLLRLFVLLIGERVAGAYYGFSHGNTSAYYLSGFDAEFGSLSIGSLLISEAIKMARSEGCRTFDFLRGCEPYKYRWGAVDQLGFRYRVRANT